MKFLPAEKTGAEKTPLAELPHLSLPDFFAQKGSPKTAAKRVALIGYWLEYLSDEKKSVFKNEEILELWDK